MRLLLVVVILAVFFAGFVEAPTHSPRHHRGRNNHIEDLLRNAYSSKTKDSVPQETDRFIVRTPTNENSLGTVQLAIAFLTGIIVGMLLIGIPVVVFNRRRMIGCLGVSVRARDLPMIIIESPSNHSTASPPSSPTPKNEESIVFIRCGDMTEEKVQATYV